MSSKWTVDDALLITARFAEWLGTVRSESAQQALRLGLAVALLQHRLRGAVYEQVLRADAGTAKAAVGDLHVDVDRDALLAGG